MPTNKIKIAFYLVLTFSLTACFEEVIDIDLSSVEQQYVIEAVLTDQPESQYVRVSKVGGYFNEGHEQPVRGAVVKINGPANDEIIYDEIEPGLYRTTSFYGSPGNTYNLNVNAEGRVFSASSRMPDPVVMDSLILTEESNYNYYGNYYNYFYKLNCYFSDAEGVDNYLWFKYYVNGQQLTNTTYLYNDKNSDGEKILYDDFEEVYLQENDRLTLEVVAIDADAYEFIYSIFGYQSEIDIDLPELFPANSFNPNTNISNNGLGYFSACAVRKYRVR